MAPGNTPLYSLSILDYCVGQNKSQRMMKFYALMSILFYDEVAALFLISGHSYMLPDGATAHAKRALKLFKKCLAPQRIGEVS